MDIYDQDRGEYVFICLYLSRWVVIWHLSLVFSLELDSLRQAETCDRGVVNQLFQPLRMVQSAWHFVCRSPTHNITNIWSRFWSNISVVACKGFESQSIFDVFRGRISRFWSFFQVFQVFQVQKLTLPRWNQWSNS